MRCHRSLCAMPWLRGPCAMAWLRQKTAYNCLVDAVQDCHSVYCNELLKSLLENENYTARKEIEDKIEELINQNNLEAINEFLSRNKIDLIEFDVFQNFLPRDLSNKTGIEMLMTLLKHNGVPNFDYERSNSILHEACENNNLKLLEILFVEGNVDINMVNEENRTPIQCALKYNHKEVIEYLMKAEAILPDNYKGPYKIYTRKEKLLFLASTTSKTEQVWTQLSEVVLASNMELTKQAFKTGFQVDVLTIYCAIVCDNFEVFNLVWRHAHVQVIRAATRLMSLAFTSWVRPQDIAKFRLVLSTEADLNLSKCGHYFVTFLKEFVKNNWSDEIYDLVKQLGRRKLRLTSKHFIAVVEYTWDKTQRRRKLIECILQQLLPNVAISVLINSFSRDLHDLLIPYCLELNVETVFKLLCNCNPDEMLKMYIYFDKFFTLPEEKERNLCKLLLRIDEKMAKHLSELPRKNNYVKSLLELSRDCFRLYLSELLYSTCQFIKYLDQLSVPTLIKDVLQLKVAVYA